MDVFTFQYFYNKTKETLVPKREQKLKLMKYSLQM